MKKQIAGASFAILALSLTVLSACKKDSDNNSIVGTWELSKMHEVMISGTPPQTFDTTINYTHGHSLMVVLSANGHYMSIDNTSTPADTSSTGTYSFGNGRIIITEDGSSTPDTANATVSGSTMTLTNTESNATYSVTTATIFNRQ